MAFQLPELPYSYDALEPHIDARTMEIHHTKHHQGYTNNLNAALEKHPNLQQKNIEELVKGINSLKRQAAADPTPAVPTKEEVLLTVASGRTTVVGVRQTYAVVPYRHKAGALARVLSAGGRESASQNSSALTLSPRTISSEGSSVRMRSTTSISEVRLISGSSR